MSFTLSNLAELDVRNILRYTERTWGRQQRLTYSNMLENACVALGNHPDSGRSCDEIKVGYYKYLVGKHYVFYRQTAQNHIEIVRILHERMNFETHLND